MELRSAGLEVPMDHTLEKILARVQKPGRYVGGEYNAIKKEKNDVDAALPFAFRTPMRLECPT